MPAAHSLGGRVRNLANISKAHLEVDIEHADSACAAPARTFSTLDRINGTVSVTTPNNLQFDNVEIALVGTTRTYIDRLSPSAAISARSEAFQMFLKMEQPMDESTYPADGILRAGETYRFPFTFVVPEALPGSCKHKTSSMKLKDLHLRLPPSLGDPDVSGKGSAFVNDCAPEMVKISYGIRVRIHRQRQGQEKEIILAERTHKIRVIPALEEQPPVTVDESEEYCLRREKSMRKGLLKNKTGVMVMEASQPQSLHLPPPNSTSIPATTMATVQLRFDPAIESAEPPKLGQLASKLRVGTFFASTPRLSFPSTRTQLHDTNQGLYVDVVPLSSRCMSATGWLRNDPFTPSTAATLRRDSGMSLSGQATCPEPSKAHRPELPFYTAQLLIPISLPKSKTLVPTFHSCLVSRLYILELSLSLASTTSISLKVPIQISSETAGQRQDEPLPGIEIESIEQELSGVNDDYFRPHRDSAPTYTPAQGPVSGSTRNASAPPGYSSFAPRAGGVLRDGQSSSMYQQLSMVR